MQLAITWKVIEQSFGSRDALQVFWGTLSHFHNPLNNAWVNSGRPRLAGTRTGMEHRLIIGWRLPKALEPLFDETTRTAKTTSKLLLRPIRMLPSQTTQSRTVGYPLSFH